jgi:hypothetical protein
MVVGLPQAVVAESFDSCIQSLSREEFESRGGKLAMIRQPDMRFPKNISKICRGAAGLGITVLHDGVVRTEDFEHNWFSAPGDTFEVAGRTIGMCDKLMEDQVKSIRFAPPKLHEEPVCVHFYVDWASSKPNELLPFGTLSQ